MRLRTRLTLGMGAILLAMTLATWITSALLLEPLYLQQRTADVKGLVRALIAAPFSADRARQILSEKDAEHAFVVYVVDSEQRQIFNSIRGPAPSESVSAPSDPPPQSGGSSSGAPPTPPPPAPPPQKPKPFYPANEFRDLRPGNVFIMSRSEPGLGGTFLLGLGRFTGGESVVVSAPLAGIRESARTATFFLALTALLALVPGLGLVYWLSARITRPLEELSEYTRQLGGLDFRPAPTVTGAVEVVQLGAHIQAMARSVEGEMERRRALDEMRREFLSNASHELKTPLTLIQGYAEGLIEGIADNPAKRQEYLEVILDEVKKMDRHVRDLLDLSRWESGARAPDWETIDPAELIRACAARFENRWGDTVIAVEPSFTVVGDRLGIDQILSNFLTNALDHGAERPVIRITATLKAPAWRLEVFNEGPFLPPGEEERIWLSYYKADKSRTRGFGGSGLGLAIVKGIVATHGGRCGAENRPSERSSGVVFWVELPLNPQKTQSRSSSGS